jgi:hypothetical protein
MILPDPSTGSGTAAGTRRTPFGQSGNFLAPAGSAKVALPRPAHQRVTRAVETVEKVGE